MALGPGGRALREWLPDGLARRPVPPLAGIAAILLLWHLGAYGLWESTEARYAEIEARNNLPNPDLIQVGQKLVIPKA